MSGTGMNQEVGREALYREILDSLSDMVCRFRPDGTLLFVNAAYARSRGTTPELLTGANFLAFIPEEEHAAVLAMIHGLGPGSPELEVVNRFETTEGVRWTRWVNRALAWDAEGRPTELQSTGSDITARKEAELALAESEAHFRHLADSMPQLVWTMRPDGVVDYYNQRVERYAGFERLPDGSWQWHAVLHPDDVQRTMVAFQHALSTGEEYAVEHRVLTKDQGLRWHFSRGIASRNERGEIVKWFGTATDIHAVKQTEAALRESEERFRLALMAAEMGTWSWDPAEDLFTYDDRIAAILGFPPGEQMEFSQVLERFVHPRDVGAVRAAVEAASEPLGSGRYRVEFRIHRTDGEERWVLGHGRMFFSGEGPERKPVRLVGTGMDITEQRRTEDSMREIKERYELVSRAANDVIWDWDIATDRVDWNDAVQEKFGCTRQELGFTSDGWYERMHPSERDQVLASIHAAVRSQAATWSYEYRFLKNDGTYATFLDRGYIARDVHGKAYRVIGSMIDLTERRQAEEALRESEEKFRTLADNIAQLAWMADEWGRIVWYNQRWYDYTGTTPEEMQDRGWHSVHHSDHVERISRGFSEALREGQAWEETFPLRGEDGTYRWFLSTAIPIRNAEGRVIRWFGTNTDITEQRLIEETLREVDQRKDEFLAMLAHELRNPLAPIVNSIHVLAHHTAQDAVLERHRSIIERQAKHLSRMVDDLLDVSRITRGAIELRRELVDLREVVEHAVQACQPQIEARRQTLSVDLPAQPVCVDGDRDRLAQVLLNLLQNASKYTAPGGSITLECRAEGRHALARVVDTGEGISPELLPRVFELFTQADRSLDRTQGGLGIGLTMVKNLVEAHGGAVQAASAGLGHGSEFTVWLPLVHAAVDPAKEAAGKPYAQPVTLRSRPLSVLIVEDNLDAAETLQEILESEKHTVHLASTGFKALEWLDQSRQMPDVVLLDIGLPGMNGYQVASTIRERYDGARPALIALTGYAGPEDRERSRAAGFDHHLGKPVEPVQLLEMLATLSLPN